MHANMAAVHAADVIVRNLRRRVDRLYTTIANGDAISVGIINYRLDSLCRDILFLVYREYLPVYEEITNALLDAKRIIDNADDVNDEEEDAADGRGGIQHTCTSFSAGGVGRPKYLITEEQLCFFIGQLNCSIKDTARCFCVSERTIKRRLQEYGISIRKLYSEIQDGELDDRVEFVLNHMPRAGYKTVDGYLISQGVRVQRQRIRDSLYRLEPQRQELRTITAIHRRQYSVPSPLSLWHIDGHHKLIRWRFVTHGGIDGYSRAIVFLKCSTSNTAATVGQLFNEAVSNWGLPSRVRSDHGGENTQVASIMLLHPLRGPGRGSFITGRSVHNTRIERLWRDLHEQVMKNFYKLFISFERRGILDPDNDQHMFCLHKVFLPRINHCIECFVEMWNNHKLRTAGNKTPLQLFVMGLHISRGSTLSNEYFENMNEEDAQDYGIDPHGPFPVDEDHNATVLVPDTVCPLSANQIDNFNDQVRFIPDGNHSDVFDDNAYLTGLDILHDLIQPI